MSAAAITRFVRFLVKKSEREGNNNFVTELADLAAAQILKGKGSIGFLQSASGNGKSVTQAESLSCDEVAEACEDALELLRDDGGGQITSPDFSNLFERKRP